jgi:hypothetical protein
MSTIESSDLITSKMYQDNIETKQCEPKRTIPPNQKMSHIKHKPFLKLNKGLPPNQKLLYRQAKKSLSRISSELVYDSEDLETSPNQMICYKSVPLQTISFDKNGSPKRTFSRRESKRVKLE